jgi:hypothetical protein
MKHDWSLLLFLYPSIFIFFCECCISTYYSSTILCINYTNFVYLCIKSSIDNNSTHYSRIPICMSFKYDFIDSLSFTFFPFFQVQNTVIDKVNINNVNVSSLCKNSTLWIPLSMWSWRYCWWLTCKYIC